MFAMKAIFGVALQHRWRRSNDGCVAEGPGAQVDATIEAQVENLRGILNA